MRNAHLFAIAALAALAASCLVVEDDGDNGERNGRTSRDDGGVTPLANTFTVTYTAPPCAARVIMESNFRGDWQQDLAEAGPTVTWTGTLDEAKLGNEPCLATDLGRACGYVFNYRLFGCAPGWAVVQTTAGGLVQVAAPPTVSGPLPVTVTTVPNGLPGGNYALKRLF